MVLLPVWLPGPMFLLGCPLSQVPYSEGDVSLKLLSVQGVSFRGSLSRDSLCMGYLTPPQTVKSGRYVSYWNAFLLRVQWYNGGVFKVCSKFTLWFQIMTEWTKGKGLCETCHYNEAMFSEGINSSLRIAVYSGHGDCFRQLLAAGADVNNVNPSGKTPVFGAVEAGTEGALRMLIKAGADVNKPATDGETPIMRAVRCGHANCVKLLLQAGADVNSVSSPGFSTLFLFIEKGGSASFAELLINEGADVNEINKMGKNTFGPCCK